MTLSDLRQSLERPLDMGTRVTVEGTLIYRVSTCVCVQTPENHLELQLWSRVRVPPRSERDLISLWDWCVCVCVVTIQPDVCVCACECMQVNTSNQEFRDSTAKERHKKESSAAHHSQSRQRGLSSPRGLVPRPPWTHLLLQIPSRRRLQLQQ